MRASSRQQPASPHVTGRHHGAAALTLLSSVVPSLGLGRSTPATATQSGAAATAQSYCTVALPASWARKIAESRIHHAPGESLIVQGVAPDGSQVVADSTRVGRRELVVLSRDGRSRRVVYRLPSDTQQVSGVSYDGRWLAFSILISPMLESPWTMHVWDARTGRVRQLGRSTTPGPYPYPLVAAGHVFWAQADTPSHCHDCC